MLIRTGIEMTPLDPDTYPYWEYGSGSKTVKNANKKGKNQRFLIENSIVLLKKALQQFRRKSVVNQSIASFRRVNNKYD